jgi:hypothetical protein
MRNRRLRQNAVAEIEKETAACVIRQHVADGGIDLPLLNGNESWTLPIPARFILDRAWVIA